MSETLEYALLSIDALSLLLPQRQIELLEPALEVRYEEEPFGWIEVSGKEPSPVYCFSQQLALLHPAPAHRRICVLLDAPKGPFGILCDQVMLMGSLSSVPLPPAMRVPDTPILGLAHQEQQVFCISSAQALWNYAERLLLQDQGIQATSP